MDFLLLAFLWWVVASMLLHVASPVIEISREETAKSAGLFLPVEGQRLISDNVFLNKE